MFLCRRETIVSTPRRTWPRRALLGAWVACVVASVPPGSAWGASPLKIQQDSSVITVMRGDQPVLSYRYGDVPFKPYADRFLSPAGRNVLRNAPADHLHHHGLMFGLMVDDVDFWGEFPDQSPGIQRSRTLELLTTGGQVDPSSVGFRQQIDWRTVDGKSLAEEERTLTVFDAEDLPASILSWHGVIKPAAGRSSVTLSGEHYFGLGMRFVESMDQGGEFLYSKDAPGEVVRGQERVTRGRWCALRASAAGGPVTVAVFDHPSNPRHPATHFTMPAPFAYIAATLNVWREPLAISDESPLDVRYGVALWDGHQDGESIQRLYQRWVAWEDASKRSAR